MEAIVRYKGWACCGDLHNDGRISNAQVYNPAGSLVAKNLSFGSIVDYKKYVDSRLT